MGNFILKLDALSAFFLFLILLLSFLTALYGTQYLDPSEKKLGPHWFWFHLLTASMMLVVCSANAVLFLAAWELMSLSSYFLVVLDHDHKEVRRAGLLYLVASHIGLAFLTFFFFSLGEQAGGFDFDQFLQPGLALSNPTLLFLCALVGFGIKAGLVPFHVWLPEAHPAAPSHVSALMSGVLIKMGIYGLVRALTFLGQPPPTWGYLLLGAGAVSGILGILLAMAQQDLKRLLAYSSVENIGIITLGLGLGLLGLSYHLPLLAVLGFTGGLLHVLNHALYKSLLFLGAGSVLKGTGTREMSLLGGLIKTMPWTALLFLVGSAAICGLPLLNGFVSEFLIFLSAFHGFPQSSYGLMLALLAAVGSLGLIGGLAIACFTKVVGIVFLGKPRSERTTQECGWPMRLPMAFLALACLAVGIFSPVIIDLFSPVVAKAVGLPSFVVSAELGSPIESLTMLSLVFGLFFLMALVLESFRRWRVASQPTADAPTWGCAYVRPTPRMQYTASSFTQPVMNFFRSLLRPRTQSHPPEGLFPSGSDYSTQTPDPAKDSLVLPFYRRFRDGLMAGRWIQQGRIQAYLLYIALTLLALFLSSLVVP